MDSVPKKEIPASQEIKQPRKKKFLTFLTVMSGVSILWVVMMHVRYMYWLHLGVEPSFVDIPLYDKLLRWFRPVAVFVFISGFKLQYTLHKYTRSDGSFTFKGYTLHRANRILTIYFGWSIFYLICGYLYEQAKFYTGFSASMTSFFTIDKIVGVITGYGNYAYQLWFLPMLLIVSTINIFFRFVVKQPTVTYVIYLINVIVLAFLPELTYHPLDWWLTYLLNFELGVICAIFFMNDRPINSKLIIGSWIVIFIARLINPYQILEEAFLFHASILLTPVFLYLITYQLYEVSKQNIFYKIGVYTGPIFILHVPIITEATTAVVKQMNLLDYYLMIFPMTIFVTLVCVVAYHILLRINPKLAHRLF